MNNRNSLVYFPGYRFRTIFLKYSRYSTKIGNRSYTLLRKTPVISNSVSFACCRTRPTTSSIVYRHFPCVCLIFIHNATINVVTAASSLFDCMTFHVIVSILFRVSRSATLIQSFDWFEYWDKSCLSLQNSTHAPFTNVFFFFDTFTLGLFANERLHVFVNGVIVCLRRCMVWNIFNSRALYGRHFLKKIDDSFS